MIELKVMLDSVELDNKTFTPKFESNLAWIILFPLSSR